MAFDDKKWRPNVEQTIELAFQSLESHSGAGLNEERLRKYLKYYGKKLVKIMFSILSIVRNL